MLHHNSDAVLLDYTGAVLCPFHGPQDGAAWAAGRAPCGCQWLPVGKHGLRAVRGAIAAAIFATEIAPLPDSVTGELALIDPT